jgi:subtilisin family serine protease
MPIMDERPQSEGRAFVVVSLRHGSWPLDLDAQRALARDLQDRALSSDLANGFTIVRRFETVPALSGWIDPRAFERARLMQAAGTGVLSAIDVDTSGGSEPADPGNSGGGGLADSVPLIHADQVHALGITGSGVEIAVLDTGLDRDHPDLQGGLLTEQCFCYRPAGGCCPGGGSSQSGPGSAEDDHGHGSHVAGIVTGDGVVGPRGVAPSAGVTMVKMLDSSNSFYSSSDIVAALDWLNVNRPQVKVVSMSLYTNARFTGVCDNTFAWTQALYQAAQNLAVKGVLLVAIAGNNGVSGELPAPGCLSNVLAVGATTKADTSALFSNSHPDVDLFAPGVGIVSSAIGGGTTTMSGTSMACPHVSALAALMLEAAPETGPATLKSTMASTGKSITDWNGLTRPRIDAKAAVDTLWSPPPALAYYTIAPCRLADTRTGSGGILPPASIRTLAVAGPPTSCGIPASARAVAVNATAVDPEAVGHLTLYSGDAAVPTTSTLNFQAHVTRANNATIGLTKTGSGTLAVRNGSSGATHFVLDVHGYYE